MKIKYIDIKEFREAGYLQEVNRQFLHPLGLALEVVQYSTVIWWNPLSWINPTRKERLGGIWDYRDDPEGIHYNLESISTKELGTMKEKAKFVFQKRCVIGSNRERILGYVVEPMPGAEEIVKDLMDNSIFKAD